MSIHEHVAIRLVTLALLPLLSSSAWAQFDPNAWTFVGEPHSSGSLTPDEMVVVSSDVFPCVGTPPGLSAFMTVAPHAGIVHGHVRYSTKDAGGGQWDIAVYLHEDANFALAGSTRTEERDFSFEVAAGDSFGFGVDSTDCAQGAATATFSHFSIEPLPPAPLVSPILLVQNGLASQLGVGAALAPMGDLDGDGRGEVAVGCSIDESAGTVPGSVVVRSTRTGFPHFQLSSPAAGFSFGRALAAIGDVDGDGITELAIGAPSHSATTNGIGLVRLVSGATGSPLWTIVGSIKDSRLGAALSQLGDVDGDGIPDVAASAPGISTVFVLSGASGASLGAISVAPSLVQLELCAAGDVDGNGFPDAAIGIPYTPIAGGSAVGKVTIRDAIATTELAAVVGPTQFGVAIDGPRDGDLNGAPELLIGSPLSPYFGHASGDAIWVTPKNGKVAQTFVGSEVKTGFGRALAFIGDLDGDGTDDVAVGGYGYAQVHSGNDGAVLATLTDPTSGTAFGATVAAARDFNGDGFDDVVIGAPSASMFGISKAGRMVITTAVCGDLTNIGAGCVGSNGKVPTLAATGCVAIGTTIDLRIEKAPALAFVALLASTTAVAQTLPNGCFAYVPSGASTVMFFGKVNALGNKTLPVKLIPGALGSFVAQAFVQDAGAPSGFTTTNAVLATLP